MIEFLSTYNEVIGMTPASAITTIFGGFFAAFIVILSWPKLVEKYGPIGGLLSSTFIIGTFWICNHKLPGWGIHPDYIKDSAGNMMQFGLINQAFHGTCPWVDMGTAVFFGFWVNTLLGTEKGKRKAAVLESVPRMIVIFLGGVFGGIICGLVGFSGAKLFN